MSWERGVGFQTGPCRILGPIKSPFFKTFWRLFHRKKGPLHEGITLARLMMGLTLSSSVISCDIILLILSFICYNFFGLERINSLQPPKIVAYEEQN
jgi:hypothetical protein